MARHEDMSEIIEIQSEEVDSTSILTL